MRLRIGLSNENWKINIILMFILLNYSEIVYYEYDGPICTKCGSSMNSNGSYRVKPNKWERIRKKKNIFVQIVIKTKVTNLENFIKRYSTLYPFYL